MVESQRSQAHKRSKRPAPAPCRRRAGHRGAGGLLHRLDEPESVAAAAHGHALVVAVARRAIHRAGSRPAAIIARRLRTHRARRFPRTLRASGTDSRQPSPARPQRRRAAPRSESWRPPHSARGFASFPCAGIRRNFPSFRCRLSSGSNASHFVVVAARSRRRLRRGPRSRRRTLPDGRRPLRTTLVGRGARSARQHFSPPRSGRSIREAAPSPAGYAGNQSSNNGGVA